MEANYGYENLVSQIGEPVIIVKELPVSRLTNSPKGEWILDFGQNIAGFVRMKVNAPKGTQITLEHCEILDKQGKFFNNIQGAGGVGKVLTRRMFMSVMELQPLMNLILHTMASAMCV